MSEEGYELQYVQEAFASNWIAPLGPFVERFEQDLAALSGRRGALALNSGTAAIHLALRHAGVGAADRVLCSSLTFAASCNPIIYQQAVPVFIDSAAATWNIDPDLVEQALEEGKRTGKQAKALVAVSIYGIPADLPRLAELCDHYGVALIDEAAEALGARIEGKACGGYGSYGIYSFNGNKIITTSGGGAVLSDDLEALAKMRFWATQSRDPAPYYQHSELGFNYRLSNISAAIGCGQLEVLSKRLLRRREIFQCYAAAFAKYPYIQMMPQVGDPNYWLTVITLGLDAPLFPRQLAAVLAAENIETRPAWKPMNLQPFWQNFPYYTHSPRASVGDDIFIRGLCLPSGSGLTPAQQERVIAAIARVLR